MDSAKERERQRAVAACDAGLALLCRLAADVAGAPWAAIFAPGRRDPIWNDATRPPAALVEAATGGAAPQPGLVETRAGPDGWTAVAALPGTDGRLMALDVDLHARDPEFERRLLDVAALAAARLAAEGAEIDDDRSALRLREAEAERAQDEYRLLFENSGIGIYRCSMDGAPVRANPELVRMNGYDTEAEMLSAYTDAMAEWSVDLNRSAAFLHELHTTGRVTDFVCELYRHKTRERMWVTQNAWLIRDATGAPVAFEGTVVDASGRRRAEERIAHMARHDALTGLPNRLRFSERLVAALDERGPDEALAVMILDLDRFKAVNDSLGHPAGDALLRVLADRITAQLGPRDVVARLGGDEFALFVPGAGAREAEAFAWRLRAALAQPVDLKRRRIVPSASIGIAVAPGDGADPTALLRAADVALYSAKGAGRDGFRRFDPAMDAAMTERERLEDDLRAGLERGAFGLSFEPVADLATGHIVAFEALLRWTDPRRGAAQLEAFLPVAEETGAIIEIGAWALPRACAAAAGWQDGAALWLKVSAVELASAGFEATLAAALAASRLAPERLVLQIGETALDGDQTALAARLARLRGLGLRLALDDFGAGQAALHGLRRLRFDLLKLDASFAADLCDPRTAALVAGLIDLGRRLGLATVAEGIETETQRALLRDMGCAYGQGPRIGAPVGVAPC